MSYFNQNVKLQYEYITRHFDTVGDGSGSIEQAVNGSSTPVMFKIKPGPGEIYQLSRIMWYVNDTGSFDSGLWGNNVTMTNGIELSYTQNGATKSLVNGEPIKTSGELASFMYDISHFNFGQGAEFLVARWTFNKTGENIRLIGDNGDEMTVTINDNLTGLNSQTLIAQGFNESNQY